MPVRNLHNEIYESLRLSIIMGDFLPGQVFSTRGIADSFGTSLMPARDAMKRLVAERGLELLPNRSFCIPKMSRQRFQELLQVRMYLESVLTERACAVLSPEGLRSIESINEDMQLAVLANDVRGYLSANHRFHFGIYQAAHTMEILPIVESMWLQTGPFLNAVFTKYGTVNAQDNHTQVIKALRRRDAAVAADAIRSDLADAADLILANAEFVVDSDPSLAQRTQSVNGRAHKDRQPEPLLENTP